MKPATLYVRLSILIFMISGCGGGGGVDFTPAEYIRATGSASPGEETRIALADGAAIVIPAHSIRAEISILVERNPEKANSLPPLGDDVVQLGDFYNFEITGDVVGPVDLVLPFDSSLIPQGEGVLVFAYPTEDGWRYEPVVADGNMVTVYADNVGDPLIAWHYSKGGKPVCDPKIAIQAVPSGESYKLVGQIIPVKNNFWGQSEDQAAANVDVLLELNRHGWRDQSLGRTYTVTTDLDGTFQLDLSQEDIIAGWNWVFASAECEPWFGQFAVESEGYAEFKYQPVAAVDEGEDGETFDEVEVEEEPYIPPGALLLPDFTGQPLDDTIDWLEANGFGYTWIDGSSIYDLGLVYAQAPAGGQYKVPHRTVVVLYRTVEKLADRYGCDLEILTPQETANCGPHYYEHISSVIELTGNYDHCEPNPLQEPREFGFYFRQCDDGRLCWQNEDDIRVKENTFESELYWEDTGCNPNTCWSINRWTYELTLDGYKYYHSYFGESYSGSYWSCVTIDTYIFGDK